MQTNNQVPVIVLTGFLGAGKTTHGRGKGRHLSQSVVHGSWNWVHGQFKRGNERGNNL